MSGTTNSAIFDYHRSMIAFHGNDGPAALGWTDAESQLIRFKVLSEMTDLSGSSILDAGCGHGDLAGYLLPLYPQLSYVGIEQIPELLTEAKKRHNFLPGTRFIMADFMTDKLPLSDYVMVSGSLNYQQDDVAFIYKAINKLFECCKKGMAFNLLQRIIPNGLLAAYDPQVILAYCRSISSNVRLRTDYSPEDFTIYIYR